MNSTISSVQDSKSVTECKLTNVSIAKQRLREDEDTRISLTLALPQHRERTKFSGCSSLISITASKFEVKPASTQSVKITDSKTTQIPVTVVLTPNRPGTSTVVIHNGKEAKSYAFDVRDRFGLNLQQKEAVNILVKIFVFVSPLTIPYWLESKRKEKSRDEDKF